MKRGKFSGQGKFFEVTGQETDVGRMKKGGKGF